MFNIYTFLLVSLLFISCGTKLNYLGKTSQPTENVDVYVDAAAIKKPYTIVGKGYMEGHSISKKSIELMQKKAIITAKEKGADAILFQDYYVIENGSGIHSVTKTDSVGSSLVSVSNARVTPVVSSKTDILFLKYN